MLISTVGSLGIGFVWGWLLVLLAGQRLGRRPFINSLALALATTLVTSQLFTITNGRTVILFLLAMTFSLLLHASWRSTLGNH